MVSLTRLQELKDELVIVGVGETDYRETYEQQKKDESLKADSYELLAIAFKRALSDCGMEKEGVDGLCVGEVASSERVGEMLGINPRWSFTPADPGMALMEAALALHSGLADCIALVQGNNQRSGGAQYGGPRAAGGEKYWAYTYWSPWGMTAQGSLYAMMWNRYMHLYGATERDLGAVAVAQRKHARMNPNAIMQKPLTIDEYLSSRYVAWPLHLYDYCLVNDGGTALIVTTEEKAKSLGKPLVHLSGFGRAEANIEATSLGARMFDFYRKTYRLVADEAYGMSGLSPDQMDSMQIYDSFSCHIVFALEGLGFCGPGEGAAFIQDGTIELGGKLPVNTSGGHLSESYMRGWNHEIEAVRQLRGECGERQVKDARHIQCVFNAGGKISSVILGRD